MSALICQTEVALVAALNAVPPSDPHFGYLAGCASRVMADTRPQLRDVPVHLRRMGDPHMHADAQSLPFSKRSSPVATLRLAQPKQQFTSAYRPMSYYDILEPEAIDEIQAWLKVEHSNMVAIATFGPGTRRVRNALSLKRSLMPKKRSGLSQFSIPTLGFAHLIAQATS